MADPDAIPALAIGSDQIIPSSPVPQVIDSTPTPQMQRPTKTYSRGRRRGPSKIQPNNGQEASKKARIESGPSHTNTQSSQTAPNGNQRKTRSHTQLEKKAEAEPEAEAEQEAEQEAEPEEAAEAEPEAEQEAEQGPEQGAKEQEAPPSLIDALMSPDVLR